MTKGSHNNSYDLIITGEAPLDVFGKLTTPIYRPGGVAYSALAASALGANVGIVAGVGEDEIGGMLPEIKQLGVDLYGIFRYPENGIEYEIQNIDEIFPQKLVVKHSANMDGVSFTFPPVYTKTRILLCYPMQISFPLDVLRKIKKGGGIISSDIQHDIRDISDLSPLISQTDILFTSRDEMLCYTKSTTDQDAIKVLRKLGARLIVVKYGMGGSTVYLESDISIQIPAFLADFKCTIGAGDVYNAVFLLRYAADRNIYQAGVDAALAASVFSEHLKFPEWVEAIKQLDFSSGARRRTMIMAHPEQLINTRIYLAGHFLSVPMRNWIDSITQLLEAKGFSVFSPYRDVGLLATDASCVDREHCFEGDIIALDKSTLIVALLDGLGRGGTSWEIGYAYAKNKPIFGILTDSSLPISNMVMMSCKSIDNSLPQFLNHLMEFIGEK